MNQPPRPRFRQPASAANPSQDPGMRMVMPVGRSGWAIASGYLGLFAVLLVFAPFALITGLLAIRDINQSKDTDNPKYGMGRAIFGIVMGALGTVGLIATIVTAVMK